MPSIFAVANPKGGSGKTTVAIILAGEFAKHGYSAAIIDADSQGSSYQWHASSVARGLSPQGVDLVRAPDEKALIAAVDKLQSYDVVVIDTPAWSCAGFWLAASSSRTTWSALYRALRTDSSLSLIW